jgi:ATP-binding cassette, subfamily B, bacterial PglK
MLKSQSIRAILFNLWQYIRPERRFQFILLLGLTLVSSLTEIISLSAVVPFIGIITEPDRVFNSPLAANFITLLGAKSPSELIIPITVIFAVAGLLTGILRLMLLKFSIRLGNSTGADLSIEVYRRTLYQPYRVHVSRSSSDIISGITQKIGTASTVFISIVSVLTSLVLFLSIMVTLVAFNPQVAFIAVTIFGTTYAIIGWQARRKLEQNSQRIAKGQTQVVKILQEGLGAIRDVLLDGKQDVYCNVYRDSIVQLQRANGDNIYINHAPRFAMESLGIGMIAIFVLVLSNSAGGIGAELPMLGMLALGAQRLLPLMQQLYLNWSTVIGSKGSIVDVLELINQPLSVDVNLKEPIPLLLKNEICFNKISFKYNHSSQWVLEEINLSIPKGSRIGLIGTTGSGKSTMLDLLMGLLEPTQGEILIDGVKLTNLNQRSWQRTIAHVPQSIFLADSTIVENIALGIPLDQIDINRIHLAATQARLTDLIESRAEGYHTIVGERGVALSGGQRQRIGIARALYKQANVLVFDEATSALDNDTEESVMDAIEGLSKDLTVFIVAHRLTTLKICDTIIKLENGVIESQQSYNQLINSI